ncbi:MAG: hypothetical protein ACOCVX_01375 [Bacteroidales bacterium]
MKKTRIMLILLICLIGFIVPAYFITRSGIKTFYKQFFPMSDELVSRKDIEYENMGFLWQNGNPALSFKGFLVKKSPDSRDTLFYAEHFVISANLKPKNKHGTGVKLILLSPQIHIYPDSISGKQEVSEMPAHGEIKTSPTLYVTNLSIHDHTSEKSRVIHGIHLKVEPVSNSIHIQAKHQSFPGYLFHGGTYFSAQDGHYYFDSSFVDLNDVRLTNLNLHIQTHRRSASDITWETWLDSTRLEPFSTSSLQIKGFIKYHSSGSYSDYGNSENTHGQLICSLGSDSGKIDTMRILVNRKKSSSYNTNNLASKLKLDITSHDSFMHIHTVHNRKEESVTQRIRHVADMNAEDINVLKAFTLQGNIDADYKYYTTGTTGGQTMGYSEADIQMQHFHNTNHISHSAGEWGSKWIYTSSKNDLSVAVNLDDIFDHIFLNGKTAAINTDIQIRSLNIPGSKRTRQIQMSDNEIKIPRVDFLKKLDMSFSILADTLYYDSKLLATNNIIKINSLCKETDFTGHFHVCKNINGPLTLDIQGQSMQGFIGNISTTGLTIKDKNRLPLISRNIKLEPAPGIVKGFEIPFSYDGKNFSIERTSIKTSDFLLHLSGTGNKENQQFTLGLTAPTQHFTGPAKRILKQKSDSTSKDLNTVFMHINRDMGSVNIKTMAQ